MVYGRSRSGFTLVELLVVIAIITVLAGMTVGGALLVRNRAIEAAVVMDLKQLEMACQAYKEKFGEYPPDGRDLAAVARHLRKAFPRANITVPPTLDPSTALVFWLGGMRDSTNTKFIGFSADPSDPFQNETTSPSRIGPFFDFDLNRLSATPGTVSVTVNGTSKTVSSYQYWPPRAEGDRNSNPIVYFRPENGNYTTDGANATANFTNVKQYNRVVWPAVDMRQSNLTANPPICAWINPRGVQIFSSGLDVTYGNLTGVTATVGTVLQYPDGTNYAPETMDDITNFSGGKLESAIP